MTSFTELNPDLDHRLFCEDEAEALIAERFTPREVAAFRSCAVPAMQADYFRYCAVLALGGAYADADLICVRPLRSLFDSGDRSILIAGNNGIPFSNDFIVAPKSGNPMLRLLLDISTANIERRIDNSVGIVTGPQILAVLWVVHKVGFEAATVLLRRDGPICRRTNVQYERLIESMTRTVGDFDRVDNAFAAVRLVPRRQKERWVRDPSPSPAYKKAASYWLTRQRSGHSIFRRPK